MANLPKHWTKPTGVSSFKPVVKKVACDCCGRAFNEKQGFVVGNIDFPAGRIYCSNTCSRDAFATWLKNRFRYNVNNI